MEPPTTTHENTTTGRFWAGSASYAPSSSYAVNGKIMLFAAMLLFLALASVICFRGNPHRNRRRNRRRVQARLRSLTAGSTPCSSSRPLHRSVLVNIPAFVYSSKNATHATPFECAVCLSEFEDGEEGRVLPLCNHVFHVECIDTWFKSRSSCPLCRTPVQPPKPENPAEPSGSSCNIFKAPEPPGVTSTPSQTRFPPESSQRQPMEFLTILVDVPRETGVGLSDANGSMSPSQRNSSPKRNWSI